MGSEAVGPDNELVERLRHADESAFRDLVGRFDSGLRRMARMYVAEGVADDVVQDTWVAVIRGIERFEGPAFNPTARISGQTIIRVRP